MSTEARVVAPQQKIGARPGAGTLGSRPQPTPEPEPTKPKSRRGLSMIIGVVIVVAAAAAYWFLAGPGAGSAEEAAPIEAVAEHVELGEVQILDSISVNLAGGHYLRIGLGLQLAADGHGDVDAAKALDAAIALFSGRDQVELMDNAVREELKAELAHALEELYEGEVLDVYYTDFVTQ